MVSLLRGRRGLTFANGRLLAFALALALIVFSNVAFAELVPTVRPGMVRRQEVLPTGATTIDTQPQPTTSASLANDPLLAIMPEFVFSMPAQIVVDGINLALLCILAIQLLFTAQYHYPFSRKNYCLQVSSVLMLLISVVVHLNAVLSKLKKQSHTWPYMFAYIGVQMPPQDGSWNRAQQALFLLMRAISIASVHLTHIQFLTLLYPSALEARLILWMLGPLALAASAMEFTNLAPEDDVKTSDLGDSIRNICNSALFLLYTSALLIWGFLVNRPRAWRTDGGTAAFGGGSVGLALINTTLSFVEIAYDRLWWLPDLCWTLTIWQSWLGFWWWVGSGMGIGEVEDRAERQERRRKREEKLRRKRDREERIRRKAAAGLPTGTSAAAVAAASSSLSENSDAILGSMRRLRARITGGETDEAQRTLSRRTNRGPGAGSANGDAIELDRMDQMEGTGAPALTGVTVDDGRADGSDEIRTTADSNSDTQPTTSGVATSSGGWFSTATHYIAAHQPNFIKRRIRRLRLAHAEAARQAATEQSALREQVLNRQTAPQAPGLRTMIGDHRMHSLASGSDARGFGGDSMLHSIDSHSKRHPSLTIPTLHRDQSANSSVYDSAAGAAAAAAARRSSSASTPLRSANPVQPAAQQQQHDEEWVDDEEEEDRAAQRAGAAGGDGTASEQEEMATLAETGSRNEPSHGRSLLWRGGLRAARLRDHTRYD